MHRSTVPGILYVVIIIIILSSVAFIDGTKPILLKGEKACGMYVLEYTNGDSGREIGEMANSSVCASTCYEDPRCVAVDFNTKYHLCYAHYRKTYINTNAFCIRFEKFKCSTGCRDKFRKFRYMLPKTFGRAIRGTNVDECKEYCLRHPKCIGIHVKSKPFTCYMKTSPVRTPYQSIPHTTYYMRLRCITPKPLPPKVTPAPKVRTYKRYPNEKKVCGIHMYIGANSDTGKNLGRMKEPLECVMACDKDDKCKASDFDMKTQDCYSHPSTKNIQVRQCCMRFEKFCEYGGCHEKFERIEHRSPPHKGQAYRTTNPEECKKHCLKFPDCRGFSIDYSRNKCFLQNRLFIKFERIRGIIYYIRPRCFLDIKNKTVQQEIMQIFNDRIRELRRPIKRTYGNGQFHHGQTDVIFLVDSSGSIKKKNRYHGQDNWRLVLAFVRKIISVVVDTPNSDPRFAFVSFSTFARLEFDFKRYGTNYRQLERDVMSIPYIGGHTNMTGGFLTVEDRLLGEGIGGNRLRAKDVIVLITDGVNTRDRGMLRPVVSRIRSHYVQVIGVGVTSDVKAAEIKSLLSNERYYVEVEKFSNLAQAAPRVANIITIV